MEILRKKNFVISDGNRHLEARRVDYLVDPIQVDTDDTEDVWVAL